MRRMDAVACLVLAAMIFWPVAHVRAQHSSNTPTGLPNNGRSDDSDTNASAKIEARQLKLRNSERQHKIQSDTDRLVELATQLKEQLGKQDKSVAPADAAKKAEEIEKLARSVQQKMKS